MCIRDRPPLIHYATPGTYDVSLTVTNAFGFDELVQVGYIYVGGVGVDELSQNSIRVYPNPVKDVLTIESVSNIQQVQIYNITGQVVLTTQTSSKSVTMNTSLLKSGIYFLKVKTDSGSFDKKINVQ